MTQFFGSNSFPQVQITLPEGWTITEGSGENYEELVLRPPREPNKQAFIDVIIRLSKDAFSVDLPSLVEQLLVQRKRLSKFELLSRASDLVNGEEAVILDMAYQLPGTLDSLRFSWQTVLEKRAIAVRGSILIEIILTAPLGEFSPNLGVFWQVLRSIRFGEDPG